MTNKQGALEAHLRLIAAQLIETADVISRLESERDYYRREAFKWANRARRNHELSVAERIQLDAYEQSLPVG